MGRKKTGKNINCLHCGHEFYVPLSRFKRGNVQFCGHSCARTYKNLTDNPSKKEEVKKKISDNHADFSGKNNPMYGRKGIKAPSYKHGLCTENQPRMAPYQIKAELNLLKICHLCGSTSRLEVHHKDGNHKNNDLINLIWLCKPCHLEKAHTWERDELGRFIGAKTNPL